MAVSYGFYNSQNGDRTYDAVQVSSLFDGLINDGVYASIGDTFVVRATSPASMGITVGIGRAWFNHTWTLNDAVLPLTLDPAEVLQDRIDAVVLEVDSQVSSRTNTIKIVKGTPDSSNPQRPTMINDDSRGLYQHPFAYIRVNKQVTSITQANITNAVGTSACPFVTGIIQVTSLDSLLGQWETELNEFVAGQEAIIESWIASSESEFDTWFETVQDVIYDTPEGTYGNLYQLYQTLSSTVQTLSTAVQGKQDILTWDTSPTNGSTNPVTSGGIYTALSGKQNTLSWDTTPTSGSTKPVTSGGLYTKFSNYPSKISSGTAAPSGGSNGDVYLRYST